MNNYYNYYSGYGNYYGGYNNNYESFYDPDKSIQMYGASIGWGKRLRWPDDYFTLSAELSYQRFILKDWSYLYIKLNNGEYMSTGNCNNLSLNLTLARNSTDNPIFPRRGSEFSASVQLTPPYSLFSNKDYSVYGKDDYDEAASMFNWIEYHKWKFKSKTYTALTGGQKCPVIMTRAEFGLLGHYNKYKKSPFETFYMGGDGMTGYSTSYASETIALRGYENGSLTPYGSEGYAYVRLGAELRYPLMLENSTSIYALGFIEGGNAWTDVSKFNPFQLKRSAGVGVRIFLPMIGMMGIDWAYGFQKFALIDMEYILKNIPAYEQANTQLNQASQQYQSEVEAKAKEAEALYKEYQKASASLSAAQKTQREEAIVAKEKEAAELRKKYFGPEGEMAKKQEALIAPIQDKIYEAVKQISEQKGYAAVVDRGSAQSIIFASPSIDISNEVLSRLGYSN